MQNQSCIGFVETEEVDNMLYKAFLGDTNYTFERCTSFMIKDLEVYRLEQIVSEIYLDIEGVRFYYNISDIRLRECFRGSTTFNCNIRRPSNIKFPSRIHLFVRTKIPVGVCCCVESVFGSKAFLEETALNTPHNPSGNKKKCCECCALI